MPAGKAATPPPRTPNRSGCSPRRWRIWAGRRLRGDGIPVTMGAGINHVLVPRRARKLFRQQKSLHAEASIGWSDEGFSDKSELTTSLHPWTHYRRWGENKAVLVMFLTDTQFNLVPKRHIPERGAGRDEKPAGEGPHSKSRKAGKGGVRIAAQKSPLSDFRADRRNPSSVAAALGGVQDAACPVGLRLARRRYCASAASCQMT